jgi:cytochrome c oxidase subunit 5b
MECGNVVKLNYVGPEEDPHSRMFSPWTYYSFICINMLTIPLLDDHDHGHHHPPHVEPKTFADYVKPEYWYR